MLDGVPLRGHISELNVRITVVCKVGLLLLLLLLLGLQTLVHTVPLTSHVHTLMRWFRKDLVEVFLKIMAMDASAPKKDVAVFQNLMQVRQVSPQP